MPLEGEYEPSTEQWVRDQVELIESTDGREGTEMRGMKVVVVTSRGVRSGKLRKNPVMRVEHGGAYAVVASKGGAPDNPQWYANMKAAPLVELRDGTMVGDYLAREVDGDERAAWWERAVAAFPNYAEYQEKTDRTIPVLVLERA